MSCIEELYGDLYDRFYESKWANNRLTAFKLQVGEDYCSGPLFIGRAPNGWSSFCPKQWDREDFIDDPMLPDGDTEFSDWLRNNGNRYYKISRSQFWQDARRIFDNLYDGCFETDIAYSNLCKISKPNGNPTDDQCDEQLDICREILLDEIYELEPECIVFMTGYGWANWFFEVWDEVSYDDEIKDGIELSGQISGYPFVVLQHPQGRSSRGRWEAINDAVEYFQEGWE